MDTDPATTVADTDRAVDTDRATTAVAVADTDRAVDMDRATTVVDTEVPTADTENLATATRAATAGVYCCSISLSVALIYMRNVNWNHAH